MKSLMVDYDIYMRESQGDFVHSCKKMKQLKIRGRALTEVIQ
jgi:hypothetical protein